MSYLVLARKYRPQRFDEIVGQMHVARTLKNAIKSDRVAHAYLFTGTRGVGKTTAARILAKALNCEKGPAEEPCNECANCRQITEGRSTDVFEIDGASNTGVDDVRELRENARFMPQSSRYKIYIIDEVHMLSTSAFNALLKTLEEPPEHVIFIFATTEPHKIPDTVHSRCQQYDFKMIPQRLLFDHLKTLAKSESVKLEDASLHMIVRKAEGSMRDALSFLDQAISFGGDKIKVEDLLDILGVVDREILLRLSSSILAGNPDATLEVLEKLQQTSWDVKQFYGDLLEHFRNILVAKIAKKPESMIDTTDEEISELQKQGANVSIETLQRLFAILLENEDLVIRSGNPRLVLEMTLLRMAHARPIVPLDELVREIASLKKTLSEQGGASSVPFPESQKPEPQKSRPPAQKPPVKAPDPKPAVEQKPPQPKPKGDLAGRFLKELSKTNEALASLFEDVKIQSQNETSLVYGVRDGFLLKRLKSMTMEIEQAIIKAAGPDGKVELVKTKEGEKENTLIKEMKKQDQAQARLAEIRKESQEESVVQWVLEKFEDTEVTVSVKENKKQ